MTRAALLLSEDKLQSYAAAVTGGTNVVTVSTFADLKSALVTPGNDVRLDPNIGVPNPNGITGHRLLEWSSEVKFASNVTFDYDGVICEMKHGAGFPANTAMVNTFDTNGVPASNVIINKMWLSGDRATTPEDNSGGINIRCEGFWINGCTIKQFWNDAIEPARRATLGAITNCLISDTTKGILLYYPNDEGSLRSITIANNYLSADQRIPYNTAGERVHIFNNLCEGTKYRAVLAGRLFGQGDFDNRTGLSIDMISEGNILRNNFRSVTTPVSHSTYNEGYVDGKIWSYGDNLDTPGQGDVVIDAATRPWTPPYSATIKPESEVEAYITAHAGVLGADTTTPSIPAWSLGTERAAVPGIFLSTSPTKPPAPTAQPTVITFPMTLYVWTDDTNAAVTFPAGGYWTYEQYSGTPLITGARGTANNQLDLTAAPDGIYGIQAVLHQSDGTVVAVTKADMTVGTPNTNTPPVANANLAVQTEYETPVDITLTGNDPENDSLTFALVTQPANGAVTGTGADVSYQPNQNFSGVDSFTFKVNDGALDSAPVEVRVTVAAQEAFNDADANTVINVSPSDGGIQKYPINMQNTSKTPVIDPTDPEGDNDLFTVETNGTGYDITVDVDEARNRGLSQVKVKVTSN